MVSAPANVRRHFLPWDRPLLPQAVAWLATGWNGEGPLDLSDTLVVVPTRQSGRRLREALARHAATRSQAVFPPRVVLPEQLFDLAAAPGIQVASRAALLLAWVTVLRSVDLGDFRAVFPVDPPQRGFPWALQLAEEFSRLQETLAEAGLRFGEVAARAGVETERWRQLAGLESRHDGELASRRLAAPPAAQIAAAARPAPPPAGMRRLVVLAVVDPRPLVLAVLAQWSLALETTIAIHAEESAAARFDGWGRPLPEAWCEAPLDLPEFEQRVQVCADAAAQGEQVARWAKAYADRDGVLAVGCADAAAIPSLATAIKAEGRPVYLPQGEALGQQALAGLIAALRLATREEAWEAVAAFARQGEVLAWLERTIAGFSAAKFLTALDDLQGRHLPPTLAEARRQVAQGEAGRLAASLGPALERIADLLGGVRTGAFPGAWQAALAEIFTGRGVDTARPADLALAEAAEAWRTTIGAVAEAAPPDLAADEAAELAARLFGALRRFEDKPAGAVEIDGWLELLFRDEPHLIVAGCNDGAVPEAISGHAFLPETLREKLGLKTNAQRLARDACLLQALAAWRRGQTGRLDLLLGRNSAVGDPLRPSRLLFLCADPELPARVRFLFRELPPPGGNAPWQRGWRLRPARVAPADRLAALRVTAFRDYLRCPFRFYLRHVLRLQPVAADKRELDARDFGDLMHRVLERLGHDPAWRDCTDERALADGFLAELDRRVAGRFGRDLSLPLIVQVESARQRLVQAARVQAATRAEGWVIEHVEWKFPATGLALGGLAVSGTIDRIERHAGTGRWRVLDYKTAESALAPLDAHVRGVRSGDPEEIQLPEARLQLGVRRSAWVDLQLPLYRWAVGEVLGAAEVTSGYFNLPKAVGETAIAVWEDDDEGLHRAALACAEAVARAVAAGRFWPPREDVKHDEFAALFHDGAAESVAWEGAR